MRQFGTLSWGCFIASAMCLFAVADWPYGYYMLLRWVVFVAALIAGFVLLSRKHRFTPLAAFGLVILFNPIAKIHFERGTWAVLDLLAAALLVRLGFLTAEPPPGLEDKG